MVCSLIGGFSRDRFEGRKVQGTCEGDEGRSNNMSGAPIHVFSDKVADRNC